MKRSFVRNLMKHTVVASALLLAPLGLISVEASVIDLRNLPNNFEQASFGQSGATPFYAQSVIADAGFLNEARALVHAAFGDDVQFNFLITGDRPDAGGGLGFAPDLTDIRFSSGTLTALDGQPLTEFVVNPNISVALGERLFLVLDSFSYPGTGFGAVLATQFNALVDPYLPGEFVFNNAIGLTTFAEVNASNWEHRAANNQDLAILASFTNAPGAVPEPSTLALVLMGALGLIGRVRHRSPA